MKVNKFNAVWIFLCVVLVILLTISIYLGISGWYYKTDFSYTIDMKLGETKLIDLQKNSASAISFNLEGGFLEEDNLSQIINLINSSEEKLYIRAKAFICDKNNNSKELGINENINWTYNDDGYYYFNDLISPNEKINFCSNIFFKKDSNLNTNTKYMVIVLVETLSSNQSIQQIWNYNFI